jgi:predicted component of type VI protein secretion system
LWRTSFAEAIVYFEHRIAKVTPQVKRTRFEETTDPS